MKQPNTTVILGSQWGDEGKGKIVDTLAEKADLIVRYSGGNNAGHTVVVGKEVYKLHLLPSGTVRNKMSVLSNGVVIDPKFLLQEITNIKTRDISVEKTLLIDPRAHIIMPWHILLDGAREAKKGKKKIGTTNKGIGPCYEDKYARDGIRFEDLINPKKLEERINYLYPLKKDILQKVFGLTAFPSKESILTEFNEYGKQLKSYSCDTTKLIDEYVQQDKKIIFEGAQGILLDCALGTYPFVTSSHPGTAGIPIGTGIAPRAITNIEPVVKAYTTRVGAGPFPTELLLEQADSNEEYNVKTFTDQKKHKTEESVLGEFLRRQGHEFGTTTGRPRRTGWLDTVLIKTGAIWNGYTGLHITKLDVLGGMEEIKVCTSYKVNGQTTKNIPASSEDFINAEPQYLTFPGFKLLSDDDWKTVVEESKKIGFKALPKNAFKYIQFIEEETGIPVLSVSVGPRRDSILFRV